MIGTEAEIAFRLEGDLRPGHRPGVSETFEFIVDALPAIEVADTRIANYCSALILGQSEGETINLATQYRAPSCGST
jgi:2-keto-4-pentenoate hydratase